jgi:hypothetical protein
MLLRAMKSSIKAGGCVAMVTMDALITPNENKRAESQNTPTLD